MASMLKASESRDTMRMGDDAATVSARYSLAAAAVHEFMAVIIAARTLLLTTGNDGKAGDDERGGVKAGDAVEHGMWILGGRLSY